MAFFSQHTCLFFIACDLEFGTAVQRITIFLPLSVRSTSYSIEPWLHLKAPLSLSIRFLLSHCLPVYVSVSFSFPIRTSLRLYYMSLWHRLPDDFSFLTQRISLIILSHQPFGNRICSSLSLFTSSSSFYFSSSSFYSSLSTSTPLLSLASRLPARLPITPCIHHALHTFHTYENSTTLWRYINAYTYKWINVHEKSKWMSCVNERYGRRKRSPAFDWGSEICLEVVFHDFEWSSSTPSTYQCSAYNLHILLLLLLLLLYLLLTILIVRLLIRFIFLVLSFVRYSSPICVALVRF